MPDQLDALTKEIEEVESEILAIKQNTRRRFQELQKRHPSLLIKIEASWKEDVMPRGMVPAAIVL